MQSEIERTGLLVKIKKSLILPKEHPRALCCLSANVERMAAKRTGFVVPYFAQRGLEIPGLS